MERFKASNKRNKVAVKELAHKRQRTRNDSSSWVGRGKPGPGRKAGVPNKMTSMLREAVVLAAETHGEDGKGKHGLVGYCLMLATKEPKTFAALMARAMPMQVTGPNDGPVQVLQLDNTLLSKMSPEELAVLERALGREAGSVEDLPEPTVAADEYAATVQ